MKARLLAFVLLTVGCGPHRESGNLSSAEVNEALAHVTVEPGLWETTSEVTGVSGPGLPYEVRRRMLGPRPPARGCVAPEQAGRLIAGGQCRYRQFSMAGGRLSGAMTCPALPRPTIATMEGRYEPHHYVFTMRMETAMPDGAAMILEIRGRGQRIGACPAGAEGEVK